MGKPSNLEHPSAVGSIQPRVFQCVVSLGKNCEVAHQLKIWRGELSATSESEILDGNWGGNSSLFDWCITSLWSICECLEGRCSGIFEKHNLIISDEIDCNGYNYVTDTRYGIQFQHVFSRTNNLVTPTIVEGEYEEKRGKVLHLASKLLGVIASSKPTLYIRRGDEEISLLKRLIDTLKKINHAHDFHIVCVRSEDIILDDNEYAPHLSFYTMAYTNDWRGDSEEWSRMLRQYTGHNLLPK